MKLLSTFNVNVITIATSGSKTTHPKVRFTDVSAQCSKLRRSADAVLQTTVFLRFCTLSMFPSVCPPCIMVFFGASCSDKIEMIETAQQVELNLF